MADVQPRRVQRSGYACAASAARKAAPKAKAKSPDLVGKRPRNRAATARPAARRAGLASGRQPLRVRAFFSVTVDTPSTVELPSDEAAWTRTARARRDACRRAPPERRSSAPATGARKAARSARSAARGAGAAGTLAAAALRTRGAAAARAARLLCSMVAAITARGAREGVRSCTGRAARAAPVAVASLARRSCRQQSIGRLRACRRGISRGIPRGRSRATPRCAATRHVGLPVRRALLRATRFQPDACTAPLRRLRRRARRCAARAARRAPWPPRLARQRCAHAGRVVAASVLPASL